MVDENYQETSEKVLFNADGRKSNADLRRFSSKSICDHLRAICGNLRLRKVFQCSLFIIAFTQISNAFSQETWERSESQFCTVYHRPDIDFRLISRRIDIRAIQTTNIRRAPIKEGEKGVFLEKLDTIFKKVEEVLDMYPSRINVNIKIFSSQEGLDKAYEELFNEPNTTVSFYVFKTNTIYTTEKAISESILAHEMAHCIIDHYFVILPPRKVQEILAVYADMHLFD